MPSIQGLVGPAILAAKANGMSADTGLDLAAEVQDVVRQTLSTPEGTPADDRLVDLIFEGLFSVAHGPDLLKDLAFIGLMVERGYIERWG